jgi:hypothetical protein
VGGERPTSFLIKLLFSIVVPYGSILVLNKLLTVIYYVVNKFLTSDLICSQLVPQVPNSTTLYPLCFAQSSLITYLASPREKTATYLFWECPKFWANLTFLWESSVPLLYKIVRTDLTFSNTSFLACDNLPRYQDFLFFLNRLVLKDASCHQCDKSLFSPPVLTNWISHFQFFKKIQLKLGNIWEINIIRNW